MSNFTLAQTAQLLKPIAPQRVLKDAKGHSHVSQQDVTAHLIRVFGFGGFDTDILDVQCVFEMPTKSISKGKQAPDPDRYDVCYRALLRLSVRDDDGNVVCHFDDGSTATAQNQPRGDAHDLAYKSALSLAKKRAAINLGDQFGLSLYNKGQMEALVKDTLIRADAGEAPQDMQEGITQQVSMGNDEIEHEPEADPQMVEDLVMGFELGIQAAATTAELFELGKGIAVAPIPKGAKDSIRAKYTARKNELTAQVPA